MSYCLKRVVSIFGRFWTFLVSSATSPRAALEILKATRLNAVGFYDYFTLLSPVLLYSYLNLFILPVFRQFWGAIFKSKLRENWLFWISLINRELVSVQN